MIKSLFIFLFTIINTLYISAAQETDRFIVCSYNIDGHGRTEDGPVRPLTEWRIKPRTEANIEILREIIIKESPHIIHIQEARIFTVFDNELIDSVTPFIDFFETMGYSSIVHEYNPFSYITAFKSSLIFLNMEILYFSRTPKHPTERGLSNEDKIKNNFGELRERSALITHFKDEKDNEYYAFNVHLNVLEEHRIESCKLIRDKVDEIINKKSTAKIIITGDFNTFPNWAGPQQINIMTENGLQQATNNVYLYNTNKQIFSTFVAWPFSYLDKEEALRSEIEFIEHLPEEKRKDAYYNLFETQSNALGGVLDQVFFKNFSQGITYVKPANLCGNLDSFDDETVKKYILDHRTLAFGSDHQPIIIFFER